MDLTRRDFLKDIAFATAVIGLPTWVDQLDDTTQSVGSPFGGPGNAWALRPASDIGQGNPIVTTLNRVAFGARPGDFERVQAMGIDAYIEEQLYPEKIDDSAIEQKIAQMYPTLSKSNAELMRDYPQPRPLSPEERAYRAFRAEEQGTRPYMPPGPLQVVAELQEATVMRAIYSQRQLMQVMVEFWSNHFSIYALKNDCRWMKTLDDREVIRRHSLGKFGDMLLASAQSPAMLEYLDNRLNVKGIANENYAREIMELHTLGVNGGYTQKDVAELARVFTGWGIRLPRRSGVLTPDYDGSGVFEFDPKKHDDGPKRVLGVDLASGGGINDALKLIDVLAHHPSTAHYVATRLVRRFVSDDPPSTLVHNAANTFAKTDGDIRAVLSTILHSDEFKNSFAQKIKRPFEFVVSALRALDVQLADGRATSLALRTMGQGPFMHQTPDGYPDVGVEWINTGSLLARWNYALLVGANRIPRGTVNLQGATKNATLRTVGQAVDFWTSYLLHRPIPDQDRQLFVSALGRDASADFDSARSLELVALILASTHFQYR